MEIEYYLKIFLDTIRNKQNKYLKLFKNNKKLLLNVSKVVLKYFIQDHKQNSLKSF